MNEKIIYICPISKQFVLLMTRRALKMREWKMQEWKTREFQNT